MKDRRSIYVMEFEPPASGFTMVPNAMLEDRRLSAEARAALAWMASKPKGWRLSVADATEVLGIGRDKWQRIIREVRAVGALERRSVRGRDGRIEAWAHRISWAPWVPTPSAASTCLKTRPLDVQKPENPVASAKMGPENPVPYQDYESRLKGPENPVSGSSDRLARNRFLADMINAPGWVPPSLCSPSRARELVAAGLVSSEKMRERGLL